MIVTPISYLSVIKRPNDNNHYTAIRCSTVSIMLFWNRRVNPLQAFSDADPAAIISTVPPLYNTTPRTLARALPIPGAFKTHNSQVSVSRLPSSLTMTNSLFFLFDVFKDTLPALRLISTFNEVLQKTLRSFEK